MSARSSDIYASAPMGGLLAAETKALAPSLQRCAGEHGLLLSAWPGDRPPALPLLSCWTSVRLAEGCYGGDLRARADEALPFVDDAFELVLLRHALEVAQQPQALFEEALRVLAPGGLLVITGLHPLSAWRPWLWWRGETRPSLRTHVRLGGWLRQGGLQVEGWHRVGALLPQFDAATEGTGHPLGGAYCLLARKRRRATTPIRLLPRAVRAPVPAGLAPGARRDRHAGSRG